MIIFNYCFKFDYVPHKAITAIHINKHLLYFPFLYQVKDSITSFFYITVTILKTDRCCTNTSCRGVFVQHFQVTNSLKLSQV